jgi:hypothetical protein
MASPQILQNMVRVIQGMPEFRGCMVGFRGRYGAGGPQSRLLFDGETPTLNYRNLFCVIEEVETTDDAVNDNTMAWSDIGASPGNSPNPMVVTNRSRIYPEMAGLGLACGLTIVSVVGVVGGAAAEVPSGGVSTVLIVASWAGLVANGAQCLNGLVRVGMIASEPDSETLSELDRNGAYSKLMLGIDAIGLASGIASLPTAGKSILSIVARQRLLLRLGANEAEILANLKRMNAAERAKAISELVEQASNTPEGREAIIRLARASGVGAQSIQRSTLSVRNASRMVGVVTADTTRRLHSNLLGVFGTGGGGLVSGAPSSLVGGASGFVNFIINIGDVSAAQGT